MKKREAAIITAYTGIFMGHGSDFHRYVEEKFGHSIFTHEFASKEFWEKLKELSHDDFLNVIKKMED